MKYKDPMNRLYVARMTTGVTEEKKHTATARYGIIWHGRHNRSVFVIYIDVCYLALI